MPLRTYGLAALPVGPAAAFQSNQIRRDSPLSGNGHQVPRLVFGVIVFSVDIGTLRPEKRFVPRGDRTFGAKRCALTRKVLWHQGLSRDRVIQLIPFCKLLIFLQISVATVSIRTENTTTPRWCHRP